MKNADLKAGLTQIIDGLTILRDAINDDEVAPKKKGKVEEAMNPPEVNDNDEEASVDVSKFDNMTYSELKAYAAKLGVKATGTRAELKERLAEAEAEGYEAGDADEEEEEKLKKKPAKKAKVEEPEEEEEADDANDDSDGDEAEGEDYEALADAALEEYSLEDLIEELKAVNIKATKKNVREKLIEAFEKGLLSAEEEDENDSDLDDDDNEGEEDAADEVETEESDGEDYSYDADYDLEGVNDPEYMTPDRAEAIEKLVDKINNGKFKRASAEEFLENTMTKDVLDDLGDLSELDEEELKAYYIEKKKAFIDDDGDEHDVEDPYSINDEAMCCGHKLKYNKKSELFICEVCGCEYKDE